MKFSQALHMAFTSILSNKLRSFLTMLGIIIGVVAVTVLIAVGDGAKQQVTSHIQRLGTNLITVSIKWNRDNVIHSEDLEDLSYKPGIQEVAPMKTESVIVKDGAQSTTAVLEATTPAYQLIRNVSIRDGRFIVQNDLDMKFKVVVLGSEIADDLFNERDIIGKSVMIDGTAFSVIGVLDEKGSGFEGSNDNRIIIPVSTAERLLKEKDIRVFYVTANSPDAVDGVVAQVYAFLMEKLKDENSFKIYNQKELLSTIDHTTSTLTMMLVGIAGISLLVGGIGIMNIMLVSVTERTREIGIRKAIGARKRDILFQFLIESIVISSIGGMIGVITGILGTRFLEKILMMPLSISFNIIMLACSFSMGVGILFGIYPARKAARLRPIEALRYE